jgi:ATP/ADP translocase
MTVERTHILNLKQGEWKLVLPLLLLLGVNTLVLEVSDVVATSGFISKVGIAQIPLLWIVDMLIVLLSSVVYGTVVDRLPRLRVLSWLLGLLAFLYLAIQVLFIYGAPDWLTYPLLYIVSDQQLALFPLAFWALANDLYSMSEAKRLFPLIAAGAAIGRIAGNGIAAASATFFTEQERSISALLVLGGLIFLAGLGLLWLTFNNRTIHARQDQQGSASPGEAIREGLETIKEVPILRYLAIGMTFVALTLTILEFHFLLTMDQAFDGDPVQFQSFYGYYKIGLILATLVFQWLITSNYLEKIGMKNNFVVLPATLVVGVASALAIPGIRGGASARFLARLVEWSWDEPLRKSAEGLIPDERRGRVSAFIDSYIYAFSTIVGCIALIVLFALAAQGWWPDDGVTVLYLGLAMLAAVGAVAMALRLRAVYDKSLLNWRLARSRRKSVLDDIEF